MSTAQTHPLLPHFAPVVSKRAGLALGVWGEPGVGKTHALNALLRELPCRSATLHATAPDSAWLRVLPRAARLPAWAERPLERLERGGGLEGAALADLLSAWLEALAPFVLYVEDLHEANPARGALLRDLALAATRARGVALVVTSRLEPGPPFESHPWQALTPAASAALLSEVAGSALPPEAVAWIGGHAHGNPLFTLEYFRHLTRLGHLWSDGYRWRWRPPEHDNLPTSIEAVIAHHLRAATVTPEARAVLMARAALPLETSEALWRAVTGLDAADFQAGRQALERGNVLRGDAFTHPLYRETARADLSPLERRALARRAVEALRDTLPLAAADFADEADLASHETLALLERALEGARQAGDAGSAARLLARLAAREPPEARPARLLEAAGLARGVNLALALELAQAALALDGSRLEVRLLTAELLAALGRGDEAEMLLYPLQHGLSRDPRGAARVFETRVRVKHLSHDYAGVLTLWSQRDRNRETLTDADLDAQTNATTQAMIARAMVQINRLEEAENLLAEALSAEKLENLELAELLYIRAFVPNFAGQYAAAEVGFSAFLHTLAALSDGSPRYREMRAGALQLRAYMRNVLGRPGQAASDIREALLFHAEIGDASHYAQLQSELGLYLLERGEYAAAEDTLLEARAVLERIDNPIYLSMLERIEARLHLERGAPHGDLLALKHARASLAQIERAGRPASFTTGAIFITAWAEARHGQPETALRLADELAGLSGQPGNRAGADWVRGLALERLGQPEAARRQLEAALALTAPMRLGPSLERMGLELDRLLGDGDSARARRQRFHDHGAHGPERIAARYFPTPATGYPGHGEAANPEPPTAPLRLEVLGPIRISPSSVALPNRGKGREFLTLLLEARLEGREYASDLELLDALYPDWPEDKALGALKQLVYRLRSALGAAAILRAEAGYALGALESDAEAFLHGGDTRLWRGPYGAGNVSSASEQLFAALRRQALALETEQPTEAARVAAILLEADPFDATALGLGVRALTALGDTAGAERLRARVSAEFALVGEEPPEIETTHSRP